MKTTGEILKNYRFKNNLTLTEMAEKLEVSQAFVSYIETDKKRVSEKLLKVFKNIFSEEEYIDILKYEGVATRPSHIRNELERIELNEKKDKEKKEKNYSNLSEKNKNKIKDYIEMITKIENLDNFIDISFLNDENKKKVQDYIELLKLSEKK